MRPTCSRYTSPLCYVCEQGSNLCYSVTNHLRSQREPRNRTVIQPSGLPLTDRTQCHTDWHGNRGLSLPDSDVLTTSFQDVAHSPCADQRVPYVGGTRAQPDSLADVAVERGGIEPPTTCLQDRCSTN